MTDTSKPTSFASDHAKLILGDAIETMQKIDKDSVNLIVSSPPYNIGKIYEREKKLSLTEYLAWQKDVIATASELLVEGGSICWQTGNYVEGGELFPLDMHFYAMFKEIGFKLRNRIVWRFNFGLNSDKRFSGRYETVLWFTKGDKYKFNLDPVRIPQLYPGKRHSASRSEKAGLPSGNPLGKNPSDYWEFSAENDFRNNPVWDIPNVKHNHPEKTEHPCQYPIELAERCVLAFTEKGDTVLDPFVGTGSTVIAAVKNARIGIGIDRDEGFLSLAKKRVDQLVDGTLRMRPAGKPVRRPKAGEKVASIPLEWLKDAENE
ncbi:MAG: site-specific DNA-methyltransferase [Gemmobacter sp.]|nr:site-specific DNA-methyltransferase [Gemmobacter sp.]